MLLLSSRVTDVLSSLLLPAGPDLRATSCAGGGASCADAAVTFTELGAAGDVTAAAAVAVWPAAALEETGSSMVGRCRLTVPKPMLKAPMVTFQRLRLQYYESLSNFAFDFTLRRYLTAASTTLNYISVHIVASGYSAAEDALGFAWPGASTTNADGCAAGAYTRPLVGST